MRRTSVGIWVRDLDPPSAPGCRQRSGPPQPPSSTNNPPGVQVVQEVPCWWRLHRLDPRCGCHALHPPQTSRDPGRLEGLWRACFGFRFRCQGKGQRGQCTMLSVVGNDWSINENSLNNQASDRGGLRPQAKCDMLPCWAMEEAERLPRSRLGFRPRGEWLDGACGCLRPLIGCVALPPPEQRGRRVP